MILTADWHLTDSEDDEYRWKVFAHLKHCMDSNREDEITILGDLADRKDKHSGRLVNRILEEFDTLLSYGAKVDIIMGNHDAPVTGTPFWSSLNYMQGDINFWTKPVANAKKDALLLPFTEDPAASWKFKWTDYKVAFIHQPLKGGRYGSGTLESGSNLPKFPKQLKVYAGDLHYPQTLAQVEYVGAPHRVRFGDDHDCRFLIIRDDTYAKWKEFKIDAPRKTIVQVSSIDDLVELDFKPDDMVRIRFEISPSAIEEWPVDQEAIKGWCAANKIKLASLEATLPQDGGTIAAPLFDADPTATLTAFCAKEGLDEGLVEAGHWLLKRTPE
jgi:hypothetical protein